MAARGRVGTKGGRRTRLAWLGAALVGTAALIGVSLAGVVAGATSSPTPPTYTVTTTLDGTSTGYCTSSTLPCTLRAAVALADGTSGATIVVPGAPAAYVLTSGQLTLSKPMTVKGASAAPGSTATTIDGNAADRIFTVTSTGVTITGVVLRNGAQPKGNGGAVLVASSGSLSLSASTVSASTASQGAGIEIDGSAAITQTTISGNSASGKGGGLFNAGTVTLANDTFDGNSAKGGGGVASAGTATLQADTVVNNTSNNSNGGGLYRVGGTFGVSGSILAANNAPSSRDCYGGPTFSGTNLVQYTSGCNPGGGTIVSADPQLGPLANNGGFNLTHRPVAGSPAIDAYAAPCTTPVDQRGITRPQGAGCDLGSVEYGALGLSLSLTASSSTIGAGASQVPVNNIPPSAVIPTPSTGGSTQSSQLNWSQLNWSQLNWSQLNWSQLNWSQLNWSQLNWSQLNWSQLNWSQLNWSQINYSGTNPLSTVHLSDVQLSGFPGGWDAVLKGGGTSGLPSLAGQPLETITLFTALPYLQYANVPFADLNLGGTVLASLPFLAIVLGPTPMAQIPLTAALEGAAGGTDQARLSAWCSALHTATQDPCTKMGADGTTSPLAVALSGYSLDPVSINSILVKDVAGNANDQAWFQEMPLNAFAKASTAISSIPVALLPPSWFVCGSSCGASATLGQVATVNQVVPSITLYDLFTNATSVALPAVSTATLGDLLQGLIPTSLLPWPNLNLGAVSLQNVASPAEAPLTYNLAVTVTGDRPAATTVALTLPTGFVAVPGTFTVDGVPQPDPTAGAGNVVSLALGTLAPGPHQASIAARAGLTLGTATASALGTVTAGTDSVTSAPSSAGVTVVEAFEKGTPTCPSASDYATCDTRTLAPDTLYLAQISTATDIDLYSFVAPSATGTQTQANIVLSNLPTTNCADASGPLAANVGCDYDLVAYGPPEPLIRNQPTQSLSLTPVNDTPLALYPTTSAAAPDVQQDVPVNRPPGTSVVQVSAHRGTTNEQVIIGPLVPGATYYIQVSGYNGAHSPLPYALRMSLTTQQVQPCAPAPTRTFPDATGLAQATTFGTAPHVLFLLPQHRMYTTYGAARVDPMIASLVVTATKVGGTIVPIDNVGSTAAAYTAWDNNRCSPQAANNVVREIGKQVDAARNTTPAIDTVVLVGDDSMLPMARVADRTLLANERNYAPEVPTPTGANELSGSLSSGYLLTDNAYGTYAGVSVDDHELFVPNVALGRLVETPEDIKAAADTYVNGGTLDPSTLSSALVTGYDFMASGAQAVSAALGAGGAAVNSLISPPGAASPWNASQLLASLFPAGGSPGITSFNGHYDATHLEAADRSILSTSQFAGVAPALALARHLLFSMGCHSGLSESDVSIGTPQLDWPQELTGATQGALYAGNTGFGYGDDSTIALSERLMVLYAQALAKTSSVGQALALAKQQYFASTLVLNPYDEKVLQESTFYGLPFYSLPAPVAAAFAALAPASPSPTVTTAPRGTDPATGAPTAPISVNLTVGTTPGPTTLDKVTTPNGSYYEVNGQTLTVQNRPIEPVTGLDATQPNERAHGVLITSLSSSDTSGFVPRYFRPVVDNSGTEHLLSPVGDAVFPATIAHVGQAASGASTKDLVTLAAGQAHTPLPDGTVTQRLFTSIGGVVEYSTPSDTNFTPPQVLRSSGEIVNGTVGFTIYTSGSAKRVFVLYKAAGANGSWQGADLTAIPQPDGSGTIRWWGGGPIGGAQAEFIVQAVDASGNVGVSDNKVSDFTANVVPAGGLTITLAPATPLSGWYTSDPVTATVSGATGAVSYSLDGAPFVAYTAPVAVSGSGVHHLLAQDSAGHTGSASVSIDKAAPTVSATVTPGPSVANTYTDASGHSWYDGPVTLTITGNDGLYGSGIASITYGTTTPPSTVSNSAIVSVPVTADGTYPYQYFATDVAGNVGTTGSTTFSVDTQPPAATCAPSTQPVSNGWYNANVTEQCTATDSGVGLASPATDASFTLTTSLATGTQSATAQTSTHQVCDLLKHCITVGPFIFKVDQQAPTVSASVAAGSGVASTTIGGLTWYAGPVTLTITGSDGPNGSGVASITYGATSPPATVTNSASVSVPVNGDGSYAYQYFATDVAGNQSATGSTSFAVDASAPVVKCAPTTQPIANGWYRADVMVQCTATDGGVGLASPSSLSLSTSVPDGTQNASAQAGPAQQVCDLLGNCITVGPFTFKVDRQKPTVSIISPTSASLTVGANITANYSCSDNGGSGIAGCVGTVANGTAVDTTPGTHTFTVTATDNVGNVATASVTYTVTYKVCLQYDPTNPKPSTGTFPIKLELCDAAGNNLSSPNITLTALYEDAPGNLPSPNFQGSSNLGYVFRYSSGIYIYNLDPTQGNPPLGPGSHTLYFSVSTAPGQIYAAPFTLS